MHDLAQLGYSPSVVKAMESREPMHSRQQIDTSIIESGGLIDWDNNMNSVAGVSASASQLSEIGGGGSEPINFYDDDDDYYENDVVNLMEGNAVSVGGGAPPSRALGVKTAAGTLAAGAGGAACAGGAGDDAWDDAAGRSRDTWNNEIEMGLYVLSGIIIILFMERFIQVGGRLMMSAFY